MVSFIEIYNIFFSHINLYVSFNSTKKNKLKSQKLTILLYEIKGLYKVELIANRVLQVQLSW